MKTLILLRGIPGAGKTTVSELFGDGTTIHSADDYFYENGPNPGEYDFDRDKLGAAHAQCKFLTELAMKNGAEKVVVANTFTTEKEIKPYKELADAHNYRFVSLIVENRHGNASVHSVPEEALQAMETRFTYKLR